MFAPCVRVSTPWGKCRVFFVGKAVCINFPKTMASWALTLGSTSIAQSITSLLFEQLESVTARRRRSLLSDILIGSVFFSDEKPVPVNWCLLRSIPFPRQELDMKRNRENLAGVGNPLRAAWFGFSSASRWSAKSNPIIIQRGFPKPEKVRHVERVGALKRFFPEKLLLESLRKNSKKTTSSMKRPLFRWFRRKYRIRFGSRLLPSINSGGSQFLCFEANRSAPSSVAASGAFLRQSRLLILTPVPELRFRLIRDRAIRWCTDPVFEKEMRHICLPKQCESRQFCLQALICNHSDPDWSYTLNHIETSTREAERSWRIFDSDSFLATFDAFYCSDRDKTLCDWLALVSAIDGWVCW